MNKDYDIEHIQKRLKKFKEIRERQIIRLEAIEEEISYLKKRHEQLRFSFPYQPISLQPWRDFISQQEKQEGKRVTRN